MARLSRSLAKKPGGKSSGLNHKLIDKRLETLCFANGESAIFMIIFEDIGQK